MTDVLERTSAIAQPTRFDLPAVAPDERPARRALLGQIERLEGELASLFASAWPRKGFDFTVPAPRRRGPRLLDLGELEELRDAMALRIGDARRDFRARQRVEEGNRRLIEAMLREPERYRWMRVSHEDIGEPGCKHWHVVPRWGVVGILGNWWRVKVSSGCPLATCW